MFSPEVVYKLEKILNFQIEETRIYEQPELEMTLDIVLATLWGSFMENFVEFEYYFQSNQLPIFREVIKERFNTYIIIEKPNLVIFNRIDKKYRLNG